MDTCVVFHIYSDLSYKHILCLIYAATFDKTIWSLRLHYHDCITPHQMQREDEVIYELLLIFKK